MDKKLILLFVVTNLLPTYATAATVDLKQDLGGLNIAVVPYSPEAITVTNNSTKVIACSLSYTGVSPDMASTVTIEPGKSDTMRVLEASKSAKLKCRNESRFQRNG